MTDSFVPRIAFGDVIGGDLIAGGHLEQLRAGVVAETKREPPTSWGGPMPPTELLEVPVCSVSLQDAAAYAGHFGKALPTDEQWQRALDVIGAARLQVGGIWEWTTTPHLSGVVVRGGRFRDSVDIVSDGSTSSWADRPGQDLGFRCLSRAGTSRSRDATSRSRAGP